MCIVELDRNLVGQRGEVVILLQVTAQNVLQRCGGEEEFLAQAQLLTGRRRIGRIENARQAFSLVAFAQRADVIPGVESIEQDRVDRLGRPEAQRVDALAAPANDGRVEGRGNDALGRFPHIARLALGVANDIHRAAEADFVSAFATLELPGIAVRQPALRQFHLPAVGKLLAEEAVYVADAVAIGRHLDGRHAFHETGGETAEAAVTEGCIWLQARNDGNIDAERGERVANLFHEAEVRDRIAHQAADEEFEREVVNALVAGRIDLAGRFHPLVDDAVTHDEDGGSQPVMRLGDLRILADAVGQALNDFFGENFRLGTAGGGGRDGRLRNGVHRQSSPILFGFSALCQFQSVYSALKTQFMHRYNALATRELLKRKIWRSLPSLCGKNLISIGFPILICAFSQANEKPLGFVPERLVCKGVPTLMDQLVRSVRALVAS